jgi:ADP-ribose pyrophosphatase YjhB (NUDIX family)
VPASGHSATPPIVPRRTSASQRLRHAGLRLGYRLAYHLLSSYSRVVHPRAHGCKCVLTYGEHVVLVRHTYGEREIWQLPGGGLRRNEAALDAARREMREELGVVSARFSALTTIELELVHRRVTIAAAQAELPYEPVRPDPVEIAEARFFSPDALPASVGDEVRGLVDLAFSPSATRRRMAVGE